MSLTYPRALYGWEVTTGSNDALDFKNHAGTTLACVIAPGLYTPKSFATAVQSALNNTVGVGDTFTVSFDHAAATFTITDGAGTFQLLFGSGTSNATCCATLLGFTRGGGAGNDKTGAANYTGAAAGTAPSTMSLWDFAEPVISNTPVTAQAAGTAAKLLQREVRATQNKSDGGTVETVYVTTFKKFRVTFNQMLASEQTNLESLLDWIVQGKPIAYMPDKTAGSAVMHLVLDSPTGITNAFSWLTRSEADYGELVFIEQASA